MLNKGCPSLNTFQASQLESKFNWNQGETRHTSKRFFQLDSSIFSVWSILSLSECCCSNHEEFSWWFKCDVTTSSLRKQVHMTSTCTVSYLFFKHSYAIFVLVLDLISPSAKMFNSQINWNIFYDARNSKIVWAGSIIQPST